MKRISAFFLFWGLFLTLQAQIQPSNVYLFDLEVKADTIEFVNPKYLTHFNAGGYNNHPSFFSDDELCISSQLPTEAMPELYLLNLKDSSKTRMTTTIEGEYSPFRMPDYFSFSAIRMQVNGRDSLLQLWQFPIDRLGNGKPVFKYLTNIGYYYWVNSYQVAVFMVDNPSYLAIANTVSDQLQPVATNAGRCFRTLPNGNLAYVQKSDYETWKIMEKNMYQPNAQPVKIVDTVPGAEDFAVLPNGSLLMGKGSRLYKYDRYKDDEWVEVVDLRYYQISNITRIAVSRNGKRVAIVAN